MRHCTGQIAVILAAWTTFAAGCSQGGVPGTAPVDGKVTYNGQPVAGATVSFVSEGDARMAVGVTNENGIYQLVTLDTNGAMPGKYTVLVTKTESVPDPGAPVSMDEAAKNMGKPKDPKKLLPSKYSDPAKTPLKFEVQAGRTNKFDLQLAD